MIYLLKKIALRVALVISIVFAVTDSFSQSANIYHKVEPKQTLYAISKLYSVSIEDIKRWNGLKDNTISVGQVLVIGKEKPIQAKEPEPQREPELESKPLPQKTPQQNINHDPPAQTWNQEEKVSGDFITDVNGKEIEAKIIEVSSTEIKYKKMDNLDGPTFVMSRAEIFKIKYKNGETEVITIPEPAATAPPTPQAPAESYSPPATSTPKVTSPQEEVNDNENARNFSEESPKNNNEGKLKFFSSRGNVVGLGVAITNAKFKDPDQSEKYDPGVAFMVDYKTFHHLASFNDKSGLNAYLGAGFIAYNFQKKAVNNKWFLTYISLGAGVKSYFKGIFVHIGCFTDIGIVAYQTQSSGNKVDVMKEKYLRRINAGIVYRVGYEIKRFEFFFEHRLGLANIEKKDENIDQKTTISAYIIGAGYRFGKKR